MKNAKVLGILGNPAIAQAVTPGVGYEMCVDTKIALIAWQRFGCYTGLMQKLAVVHFPKFDTSAIDAFRKRYDPDGWRIIRPHITIVSPLSEVSEERLAGCVEEACRGIEPFPIQLAGLVKVDSLLFLQVAEGNQAIVALHRKLYAGMLAPYLPADYPFEPHITLGSFQMDHGPFNEIAFDQAYAEAENMAIDIRCIFDNLSIIKGDGLNPAITVRTIKL